MTQLKSLENFDYLAAESSSLFDINQLQIQFFWQMNILEELESFGFKYGGEAENKMDLLQGEIKASNGTSVNDVLRFLISSEKLPLELQLIAKLALDEYFNFEVKNFQSQLICRCFGIGPDQLINDLQKGDTCSLDSWKEKFLVTMGCGTCGADVEKFFRESMDNPQFDQGESEDFEKCRYSKFLPSTIELEDKDKVLIKPMGKTPFEFLKYLSSCPELKNINILECSGYQVKIKNSGEDLKQLQDVMLKNHQIKLRFIF